MIPTVPGLTTVAEGSPKQKLMAKLAKLSKKSPGLFSMLMHMLSTPTGPPQPGLGTAGTPDQGQLPPPPQMPGQAQRPMGMPY